MRRQGMATVLDKNLIGTPFGAFNFEVEKGQLKYFSKVVGETNPIYFDEDIARKAGFRNIVAPPTFGFSMALARLGPIRKFSDIGLDAGTTLHGEQSFEYFEPICAGDVVTIEEIVTDVYEKKNGALKFLVTEATATLQDGTIAQKMITVFVCR